MTTKQGITVKSPLSSLVAQWCSQQKLPNYRILLQSTTGLATRLQAANSSSTFGQEKSTTIQQEEEKVYRRAGIRVPSESSFRDLFGGPAWLVRMIEIGTEEDCHIVFVRTTSRNSFVPQCLLSKITVLDASEDPWGWDKEHEANTASLQCETSKVLSLNDLPGLYESIRIFFERQAKTPLLLIWESLSPLILVHGFDSTLKFLQTIDSLPGESQGRDRQRILQVWPVRMEILTASQHAKLEDSANALLYINQGETTLMRQGIRETGNVVREVIPFSLVNQEAVKFDSNVLPFRLEELDDKLNADYKEQTTAVAEEIKSGKDQFSSDPTKQKNGRSKIQLRLESEDEGQFNATSDNFRPRIYLQEDDPEFNDLDEEDPDDDLDI